jgi:hypothetical protein
LREEETAMRRIVAVVLPLLLVCSCSNSELPTSPTAVEHGTITVLAIEAASHMGVSGLQVEVTTAGTGALLGRGVTGSDGKVSLSVPAGPVNVRFIPPSGYSYAPGVTEVTGASVTVGRGADAAFTIPLART